MLLRLRFLLLCWVVPLVASAQINTDRIMVMGRSALYYEDYVLSIQRFNSVIAVKPYLSDPYFYRGLAKFYLEDYVGAGEDCTSAIERNPFQPDYYRLRALCMIHRKRFKEAVADYEKLLDIEPHDEGGWHNWVLCHYEMQDYAKAVEGVDTMLRLWPKKAELYAMKAQLCVANTDTVAALQCVGHSLALNPFEAAALSLKAGILAERGEYKAAEAALDSTIQVVPKVAGHYINRALVRYHQKNLRGAMADYDAALEMDTTHYVGRYNRGLLRAQVGDDNRAIEDFNVVLQTDPENTMARYNRALMFGNTGNYDAALQDLNAVIEEYPNFLAGYQMRASLYRKMGHVRQAEEDEFHVFRAQLENRNGQAVPDSQRVTRKKDERRIEDYNKLIEDDEEDEMAMSYETDYKGKVQNRKTDMALQPYLLLTRYERQQEFGMPLYYKRMESLNSHLRIPLQLVHGNRMLTEEELQRHRDTVQELDSTLRRQPDNAWLYFMRAMEHYYLMDYEKALTDVSRAIELMPDEPFFYYLRMQTKACRIDVNYGEVRLDAGNTQDARWQAENLRIECLSALDDSERFHSFDAAFFGSWYNRGNLYAKMKQWKEAVREYTEAIRLNGTYAEAYYNRGIAYLMSGDHEKGVADLSKAGELGLYKAYNLIKRYRTTAAE